MRRKPNLRILAKDKEKEVVVSSSKGPAVCIDIPQNAKCLIANIKLTFGESFIDNEDNVDNM